MFERLKSILKPRKAVDATVGARDAVIITVGQTDYEKYDPFNFIGSLLLYEKHDIQNWSHREDVARYDPVARFICHTIPEVTFDDGFTFVDKDGNSIEALDPVLQELELLDYRRVFTQADKYARVHRWAVIYLSEKSRKAQDAMGDEDRLARLLSSPLRPGTPLGRLQVYAGERDVTVYETDVLGNPTMYEIRQSVKQSHQHNELKFLVHPSRLLVITPRPIRYGQVEGIGALDPVWDQLVLRRNIEYAMAFHAIKYGGGVLTIQKEKGAWSDDELSEVQREAHRASQKQALIAPGGASIEWKGPSASVDYAAEIDTLLDAIAAGCQIPKDILKGVSAGTLTGSETNLQELYAAVSQNQELYEPYIRRLCVHLTPGLLSVIMSARFDWAFTFTLSEKEQADVDLVRAQETQLKLDWMKVNELREEKGLPPVPDGDVIQGLKQLETPMFGAQVEQSQEVSQDVPEKKRNQTQREKEALEYASKAYQRMFKSFRELDAYLSARNEITRFCLDAGVGKGTYYDWRRKYT